MGFGSETQDNERVLGKNKTERGCINSTPWHKHTFLQCVPEKVVLCDEFTPFGTGTKELQRLYSVTYRESFFHCHAVIHCLSIIGMCCLKYNLKDSLSKNENSVIIYWPSCHSKPCKKCGNLPVNLPL